MEKNTLFTTPWLNLVEKKGYIYVDEPKSPSGIVGVLGRVDVGLTHRYLVSAEDRPCHDTQFEYGSYCLTGGIDKGEQPIDAAIRELHEEAGVAAAPGRFVDLGFVWPYKASSCRVYLFGVDLTGIASNIHGPLSNVLKGAGDGTEGEKTNFCTWWTRDMLVQSIDPLLHTALVRWESR